MALEVSVFLESLLRGYCGDIDAELVADDLLDELIREYGDATQTSPFDQIRPVVLPLLDLAIARATVLGRRSQSGQETEDWTKLADGLRTLRADYAADGYPASTAGAASATYQRTLSAAETESADWEW